MFNKIIERLYLKQKNNLAYYDAFLNCYNRNYYEHSFKTKFSNAKCCIGLIDINGFKKINDTFGHAKADEMLKTLVLYLYHRQEITKVIRYGGDEFIVVFNVEDKIFASKILDVTNSELSNISFTYGIDIKAENETVNSFFERIDNILYQKKKELK